jgi:gliding motility-associated-like protein
MCTGVVTKTITVLSPPEIKVGAEFYVTCAGVPVQVSVSGASNYSWTPTIGLSSSIHSVVMASPPTSQNYTVTGYIGTPPFACGTSSNILVAIEPISILSIKAPDSICYNQRVQLLASGAKDFTWTPATFLNNAFVPNPYISPKSAITYTINGIGTGSCLGTTTVNIEVKPVPYAYAGRDTVLNFDESAFLNGQGDGWLYTWIGDDMSGLSCINCPQAYIHPQYSACYILEVENSHGCIARDEVCVEVTNDHAIYIPNSFTPNGDGLNDLFTPVGFGVLEFTLDIYDRWGEKLFSGEGSFTKGPLVSWDGSYKGQRCKSDNYVYKFVYRLRGSKQLVKEGEIILLNPKD